MASATNVSAPLMFVSGYVYRMLRQEARNAGLRWTAVLVLKDLELLGPLSQQALADIEQVRRPTMTVLLQQMEELGWVERRVHSANRSSNLVRITQKGTKELRAAGRMFLARIQAALAGLPPRDLARLEAGLEAVAKMWMNQLRKRPRVTSASRSRSRRGGPLNTSRRSAAG
jgi:DNA-binding MarR family transcriptional regulator